MFVGKSSFHVLTAFLIGCDQHAARHGGFGLTGRHDWLVARRGRTCNHAWPGQVLHIALPDGMGHALGPAGPGRAARDQGPLPAPRRVHGRTGSPAPSAVTGVWGPAFVLHRLPPPAMFFTGPLPAMTPRRCQRPARTEHLHGRSNGVRRSPSSGGPRWALPEGRRGLFARRGAFAGAAIGSARVLGAVRRGGRTRARAGGRGPPARLPTCFNPFGHVCLARATAPCRRCS